MFYRNKKSSKETIDLYIDRLKKIILPQLYFFTVLYTEIFILLSGKVFV